MKGVSRLLAPRLWGGHLLAVVLVAVACWLGVWQLGAWQAQRHAEAADLSAVAPESFTEVMGADDPFPADEVGQPVELAGTWVPEGTVHVEGREHDGEDGYWVATPLEVDGGGGSALYVVRGWTASVAQAPPPPAGDASLTAWLQPTEGTNVADTDRTDDVLTQMRTADLVQHVDQDLYGAFAVARDPLPGLAPATLEQLPAASAATGLRNLLYGVEWFVFGAFAAFIWWRWSRDVLAAGEQSEEPAAEAVPSRP